MMPIYQRHISRKSLRSCFIVCVVVFSLYIGVPYAHAESLCDIEPFTTRLSAGSSANLSITTTLGSSDTAFDVELGDLPTNVESGFLDANLRDMLSATKRASLVIRAREDAQTGSFMIPVLIRIATTSPSGVEQTICQFNLVIERPATGTSDTGISAIPSRMNRSISQGILPTTVSLFDTSQVSTVAESQDSVVPVTRTMPKVFRHFSTNVASVGYYGAMFSRKILEVIRDLLP
jgi:hypothetical protein